MESFNSVIEIVLFVSCQPQCDHTTSISKDLCFSDFIVSDILIARQNGRQP